jgi:tetratricopeptide (TPR) repeat protein
MFSRRPAPAAQLRNTLTNVRSSPLWRRRIPPPLFLGIVVLLVAGLIGGVAAIRSKHPEVPPIDAKAETQRARERKLREDANSLLRQGRVSEAYAKYDELQRLAPGSPFVLTMMQKLNAIRAQEEVSKQQLAVAQQKFQDGMVQFNAKNYPAAIQLFQESFSINPSSNEAADYLKLAQQEQQKAELARANRTRPSQQHPATTTTAAGAVAVNPPTATQSEAASPASLTTVFTHPFTDGRVVVRIGADIVVNEKIFDDKPARLFRRASRVPRPVNVTSSLPAKNADVQIWVTAPRQGVPEHHLIPAVRFDAGSSHRLTIHYDDVGKKFTYELN